VVARVGLAERLAIAAAYNIITQQSESAFLNL